LSTSQNHGSVRNVNLGEKHGLLIKCVGSNV